MRQWGYPPSTTELEQLHVAAEAFRKLWASIRSPFPAAFDFAIADVNALHYMQYEGIALPDCGLEGAALVCGEVLRRVAGLEWVVDHSGQWFVASPEDDWPALAICPLSRLKELEYAHTPQFGRYLTFISRAAMDCLAFANEEREQPLRDLIAEDEDCIQELKRVISKAVQPGRES
jgi:hypothetical protein